MTNRDTNRNDFWLQDLQEKKHCGNDQKNRNIALTIAFISCCIKSSAKNNLRSSRLQHDPHSQNKKTRSPREIGWTKTPNEHCEKRRVCACTRRSKHAETNCIVKSTGMTNQETQEGMLSHFQKIGVASHFVGMLGTPKKKKKKKKNIAAIAAMTKKTHTHTLAMSNKIRGTYDFCCQLHEIQCHMKSLKLGRDILGRSKTQNNAKFLRKSVQAKL